MLFSPQNGGSDVRYILLRLILWLLARKYFWYQFQWCWFCFTNTCYTIYRCYKLLDCLYQTLRGVLIRKIPNILVIVCVWLWIYFSLSSFSLEITRWRYFWAASLNCKAIVLPLSQQEIPAKEKKKSSIKNC